LLYWYKSTNTDVMLSSRYGARTQPVFSL
jgi:hypothetical protein